MCKNLLLLGILILLFSNCDSTGTTAGSDSKSLESEELYYNQIFRRTNLFSNIALNGPSNRPNFSWEVASCSYVHAVVGIFKNRINVKNNEIVNKTDFVWTWTTQIGKGRDGNISYNDGLNVVDTEIILNVTPSPLSSGKYYWAFWTYDQYYNLICSSTEHYHNVP